MKKIAHHVNLDFDSPDTMPVDRQGDVMKAMKAWTKFMKEMGCTGMQCAKPADFLKNIKENPQLLNDC